jgi:hypothetical protein
MDFKECEEKLSVIKKLHTSNDDRSKHIWYKPKTVKSIRIVTSDKDVMFDTDIVSYLSLSNDGILIQSELAGVRSMNPFPLKKIREIEVE